MVNATVVKYIKQERNMYATWFLYADYLATSYFAQGQALAQRVAIVQLNFNQPDGSVSCKHNTLTTFYPASQLNEPANTIREDVVTVI